MGRPWDVVVAVVLAAAQSSRLFIFLGPFWHLLYLRGGVPSACFLIRTAGCSLKVGEFREAVRGMNKSYRSPGACFTRKGDALGRSRNVPRGVE